MTRRLFALLFTITAGAIAVHLAIPTIGAQTHKPVFVTRLYTGPDNQTHAEQSELKFTPGTTSEVSKLMQVNGAELHRAAAGNVEDWHRAHRRQYVITLSGQGELEIADGKKISVGPGSILLVEDTTGKGHITKVIGAEDRVTIQIPSRIRQVDRVFWR